MKVCQIVSSVIKSEICFDHLPARTSSVLVAEVGEPPDVAETNRDGDAGEEEVQLVPKRPSLRIIFLTMKKNALSSQNVIQNVTLGGEGDHLYSVFRRGVDPQLDIRRLHLSLPRLRMHMFTSTLHNSHSILNMHLELNGILVGVLIKLSSVDHLVEWIPGHSGQVPEERLQGFTIYCYTTCSRLV